MSLETGQLIDGKYRITRMIGEGGMGAVFEGENVRINRRVAIKVLHSAFTGNQEVMQRFEREAQAAGRIGNDHILEVLDLGQLADGDHFIIMEYLEGEPLSSRIKRRGRLTPEELVPLARQMLEGLSAAHTADIIHRDLKPDNIFILKEKAGVHDYVKIIDFGISKFNSLSGDGMKMTRTGAVMGTPYYMSPEQASGSAEADQRSDIYSIGVILYEAVTGQVPFDAGTFNQLMFKIVLSEVPPPQSIVPDLDPAFSSIIARSMARDLTQRFQTAAEFIAALDEWRRTGASVSVPPAADAAAAGLLPAQAARPDALVNGRTPGLPGGGRTAGNWASSQHDPLPAGLPKKSGAGLVLALCAVGVLVAGGAAFAAYSVLGGKGDAHQAAAPGPSHATAALTPAPRAAAPTAEAQAADQPRAVEPKLEAAKLEAPKAELPAAPAASAPGALGVASASAAVRAPAVFVAKASPKSFRPPERAAAAKPAAKTTGKAASATPDFGY